MELSTELNKAGSILGLAAILATVATATAFSLEHAWLRRDAAARRALYLTALLACLAAPLVALIAVSHEWTLFRIPIIQGKVAPHEPCVEHRAGLQITTTIVDSPENAVKVAAPPPLQRLSTSHLVLAALLTTWSAGFLFSLARLAYGCVVLRRVRTKLSADTGKFIPYCGILRDACGRVALRGLPHVVVCKSVGSPLVLGLWNPMIVLPAVLVEQYDEALLRDVLIHECAHIRGHDPLAGLLQRVVGAIFWFHPLIHVMNRNLTAAQEDVCDNAVLRHTPATLYATRIVDLLERTSALHRLPLASGMSLTRGTMAERIASLLNTERSLETRVSLRTLAPVIALFCTLCIAVAGASLHAEDQKPPVPTKTSDHEPDSGRKPDDGATHLVLYDVSDLAQNSLVSIDEIKNFVHWKSSPETRIELRDNRLIILQTPQVHEQIHNYLEGRRAHTDPSQVEKPWVKDLRKALSQRITCDFAAVPLEGAIDFLRKISNVPFIVDPKVAADGTIKKPISLQAADIEVGGVLEEVLKLVDLDYELRDQAVFIHVRQKVPAPTAEPDGAGAEQEEEWKQEIRKKLTRHVTFEFVDTPMADAIDFLKTLSTVDFVLDPEVTKKGLDKTPISLRLTDVELSVALKSIAKLVDLDYELRNHAVFIGKIKNVAGVSAPQIVVKTRLIEGTLDRVAPGMDKVSGKVIPLATWAEYARELAKGTQKGEIFSAPQIVLFAGQAGQVNVGEQRSYVADYDTTKNKDGNLVYDPVVKTLMTGLEIVVKASQAKKAGKIDLEESIKTSELTRVDKETRVETQTTKGKVETLELVVEKPIVDTRNATGVQSVSPDEAWVLPIPQKDSTKHIYAVISAELITDTGAVKPN